MKPITILMFFFACDTSKFFLHLGLEALTVFGVSEKPFNTVFFYTCLRWLANEQVKETYPSVRSMNSEHNTFPNDRLFMGSRNCTSEDPVQVLNISLPWKRRLKYMKMYQKNYSIRRGVINWRISKNFTWFQLKMDCKNRYLY